MAQYPFENRILRNAAELHWPAMVNCGGEVVVPGGCESAWYIWVRSAPEASLNRADQVLFDLVREVAVAPFTARSGHNLWVNERVDGSLASSAFPDSRES